jgi:hypothetical protein
MCYALTAVSIATGARSMATLITVDMLMATALIVKYALITIPSGVRVARRLTRTMIAVMRLLILVSIGVKVVAKVMLIGVMVATIILGQSARIVMVVI